MLTCAHVITDITLDTEQVFNDVTYRVRRALDHPDIDVGIIEVEPDLQGPFAYAFRDPTIAESILALGYPRIPLSQEPALVLQSGEVTNAEITTLQGRKVFLYSAVARPGNSGGPIIAISGQVLGLVTEDLASIEEQSGGDASSERNPLRFTPNTLPFFAAVHSSSVAQAVADLIPGYKIPFENYAVE